MFKKASFSILFLLLAGCASIGPSSSPEFRSLVNQALPSGSGETLLARTGVWYPNMPKSGWSFDGMELGIVVITEKALYFEEWDTKQKAYKVKFELQHQDIASVTTKSFGLNYAFYVIGKNGRSDAFDIRVAGGQTLTRGGTKEAFEILDGRVKAIATPAS